MAGATSTTYLSSPTTRKLIQITHIPKRRRRLGANRWPCMISTNADLPIGVVNAVARSAYADRIRKYQGHCFCGSNHKEFSSLLHIALEGAILLETFPKTTVDVFALVFESEGSDLPVVISCASLAL